MQKYGFEIESVGLTRSQLEQALTGIDGSTYGGHFGYHGSRVLGVRGLERGAADAHLWVSESDSSLSNHTGRGICHEVISPVLHGREGLAHLKRIMASLARAGAKVNRTCGLHITFDLNGSRMDRMSATRRARVIGRIIEAYDYFWAEGFCALVPQSRRQGMPGYNGYSPRPIITNTFGQGSDSHYRDMVRYGVGRGCVNIQSYNRAGVIEFRQHSGTVNGFKIETFALLLHRLVSWAMNDNHVNHGCDLLEFPPDVNGLLAMVDAGSDLVARVMARYDEINHDRMPSPTHFGYRTQYDLNRRPFGSDSEEVV